MLFQKLCLSLCGRQLPPRTALRCLGLGVPAVTCFSPVSSGPRDSDTTPYSHRSQKPRSHSGPLPCLQPSHPNSYQVLVGFPTRSQIILCLHLPLPTTIPPGSPRTQRKDGRKGNSQKKRGGCDDKKREGGARVQNQQMSMALILVKSTKL